MWVEKDKFWAFLLKKNLVLIFSMQKVVDDKGAKAKKGGAKGKKDDGPAQNGDSKTNEVCGGNTVGKKTTQRGKCTFSRTNAGNNDFYFFILSICV